jgi:hypothetical protein
MYNDPRVLFVMKYYRFLMKYFFCKLLRIGKFFHSLLEKELYSQAFF